MIGFYFDTEFTGLRNGTELISIGAVVGRKFFYGEIKGVDFNNSDIDPGTKEFLQKEVIPGLMFDVGQLADSIDKESGNCVVYGDKTTVANNLVLWLKGFMRDNTSRIIPISDVMYYDMVLLMDLLKSADKNPMSEEVINAVSPAGIDINPAIAVYLKSDMYTAFDKSREDLFEELTGSKPMFPGKKHNSLTDARIIQAIYHELMERGSKRS